jgi:hypothetical protein
MMRMRTPGVIRTPVTSMRTDKDSSESDKDSHTERASGAFSSTGK